VKATAAAVRFSAPRRLVIARLLQLKPASANSAIDELEKLLSVLRQGENRLAASLGKLHKAPGRPADLGFRYLEVWLLACVYLGCTGRKPANSKPGKGVESGAFYSLVRECVGKSDPSRYLKQLRASKVVPIRLAT
jgi:hypothetical protein